MSYVGLVGKLRFSDLDRSRYWNGVSFDRDIGHGVTLGDSHVVKSAEKGRARGSFFIRRSATATVVASQRPEGATQIPLADKTGEAIA